ncbi:hypothetical protein EDB87DRAFT_1578525 [Lactarius vividus]|nr:hypothetical protein EDB87DRAFT_1578525 [Lactarius vividus]
MATGPSNSSQGEGPPSYPHRYVDVDELVNWISLELRSFLNANSLRAPIVGSTQAGNSKGPEPAHANDHQGHPDDITTLSTVIVPFAGCAVPTRVTLSLVPLHLGIGQRPPSTNPLPPPPLEKPPPSQPSKPPHTSVGHPLTTSNTLNPRHLEYAQIPGGFSIALRNSTPRPQVLCDPGHGGPIQEPIPEGLPATVAASPGAAMYPPFGQTPWAYPPARTACQKGENRRSTSRQHGQTYRDTPTFSDTAGPTRSVGVDQHLSRHQCTECDASYARLSGLNRHYKDKHSARMACRRCNSEFSLGRVYTFTEHLKTCPGA